jgi:single-strand DNA-binding protein
MQNVLSVVGRVGSTPELRKTKNGKELVVFRLALNEQVGEGKQRTTWFDVEVWGDNKDNALKLITKGREVALTGRLVVDRYKDKEEKEVTSLIIKMIGFHLCGPRPETPAEEAA